MFTRKQRTALEAIEDEILRLHEREELLNDRRNEARTTLSAVLAERQRHLLNGNIEDATETNSHHARVAIAQSQLDALEDALTKLCADIEDSEKRRNGESDRLMRLAISEKLKQEGELVKNDVQDWLAKTRALSSHLEALEPASWNAGSLSRSLAQVCLEFEVAFGVALRELAQRASTLGNSNEALSTALQRLAA